MSTVTREELITEARLEGVAQVERGQAAIAAGYGRIHQAVQRVGIATDAMNLKTADYAYVGGGAMAVGGGMLLFMRQAANAAMVEEAAITRLNTAMAASGKNTAGSADEVLRYAQELQGLTGVSDEAIISAGAMLASFKMSGEEIKTFLPTLLDLQAGLRKTKGEEVPLEQLAILMGKGASGMAGALRRYGIMVDSNASMADIIKEINKEFGGQAAAYMGTTAGAMQQLRTATDNLMESFAVGLLPIIRFTSKALSVGAGALEAMNRATGGFAGVVIATTGGLLVLGGALILAVAGVRKLRDMWLEVAGAAKIAGAAQVGAANAGASAGTAANAGAGGALGKWGGKVGGMLGWLGLGSLIGGSLMQWGDEAKGTKPGDSKGAAKFATGRTLGGAATGAGIGAAIGSIVPVLGTAIGALVGAAGGAIYAGVTGYKDIQAQRAADAPAKTNSQLMQSNGYLSEIVKLLDKQNKMITGGGERLARGINQGDAQRALLNTLNASVA